MEDVLVFDVGSRRFRAGFSGDASPAVDDANVKLTGVEDQQLPTPRLGVTSHGTSQRVTWPVKRGKVEHWLALEERYTRAVSELEVEAGFGALVCARAMTSRSDKERTVEMMFESVGAGSLFLEQGAKLGMYGSGVTSGLAVDMGFGCTSVTPLFEGRVLRSESGRDIGVFQASFGGQDVTHALSSYLATEGNTTHSSLSVEFLDQFQALEALKERACFVAPSKGPSGRVAAAFELPDGRSIKLGDARHRAPERIFKGDFSISSVCHRSIQQNGIDLRRVLSSNIVIMGGPTLMQGFAERLEEDMRGLSITSAEIRVVRAAPNAIWTGGSILSGLKPFRQSWISRQQYLEVGSNVHAGRCLCEITDAQYLGGLALQLPHKSCRMEGEAHNITQHTTPSALVHLLRQLPQLPQFPTPKELERLLGEPIKDDLYAAYQLARLAERQRCEMFQDVAALHMEVEEMYTSFYRYASGVPSSSDVDTASLEELQAALLLMMGEAEDALERELKQKRACLELVAHHQRSAMLLEKIFGYLQIGTDCSRGCAAALAAQLAQHAFDAPKMIDSCAKDDLSSGGTCLCAGNACQFCGRKSAQEGNVHLHLLHCERNVEKLLCGEDENEI